MSNKKLKANYVVYCHTSPNGKKYVGQTNNYEKRCYYHKQKHNLCVAFASSIRKYGWDNFKHEILASGLTIQAANHFEQFYIKNFNTLSPNGYNLKSGGYNSLYSEESKKRMSDAQKGENHCMFGKKLSTETCIKISESMKGSKHHFFGKKHTKESIKKMSDSIKGENNHNFQMFGELNKSSKKYNIINPDGIKELIIGLNKYCKKNNLHTGAMSAVANGKYKQHKGYKCEHYIEEQQLEEAA